MRQLKITRSITNRNIGSLDKFLQEISKETLITPEEEVALAQKIKNGDQAALDKLVTSNLRFVVSVAKQYQNKGVLLLDLINEGNIGLVHAAETFDETNSPLFISLLFSFTILTNRFTLICLIFSSKKQRIQSQYTQHLYPL